MNDKQVYTTRQLFRSSPFFQAIARAYNDPNKVGGRSLLAQRQSTDRSIRLTVDHCAESTFTPSTIDTDDSNPTHPHRPQHPNTPIKSNQSDPQSELFFKLHELQTCSWGVSQIGRVAQVGGSDVTIFHVNHVHTSRPRVRWFCFSIPSPPHHHTHIHTQNSQSINLQEGELLSEFDSILFSLTTIPILGWFKLLPTFGGRVISIADGVGGQGRGPAMR